MNKAKYPQLWLFQRKHVTDPIQKDYIMKRAYVEFITPEGDMQIGINPRFNEQGIDDFKLQDKCIYSRGQPSQTKVSRLILVYIFYILAIVNIIVVISLVCETVNNHYYSSYNRFVSSLIAIVSTSLTAIGSYAMQKQSLNGLSVYIFVNSGMSIILFPLSPTPLYFMHFMLEMMLIYVASQLKYRLDDIWFVPSANDMNGQIII